MGRPHWWQDARGRRRMVRWLRRRLRHWGRGVARWCTRIWHDVVAAMRPARGRRISARTYAIRRLVVLVVAVCVIAGICFGGMRLFGFGGEPVQARPTAVTQEATGDAKSSHKAGGQADTRSGDGRSSDKQEGRRSEAQDDGSQGSASADSIQEREGATGNVDATADKALQDLGAPLDDATRAAILSKARQTAVASGRTPVQYTYCVMTKGNVGDTSAFAATVYRTLNDPRGWARAGATFVQAGEGQSCDMHLVLSAPEYMTSFAQGCSAEYSCRVGDDVIINVKRWNGGVQAWFSAGGTLARYRQMVINHEVGHRLGHYDNEQVCSGAGNPAPLMQEQSMDLRGCTPQEWPLDEELWIAS